MSASPPPEIAAAAEEESASRCFFPNKMGRIVLLALKEVVGSESMETILTMARMQDRMGQYPPNNLATEFSFDELARMQRALEELYGVRSGRGMAGRIGRACFRIGAQDLRPVLGIADVALRLLPLRLRIKVGFEVLAHIFGQFSDHRVTVQEDERYFRWVAERCGVCWGRHSEEPCCHLSVGLLEEVLYWLSGSESFYVEEVSCIAAGDPMCTILVGKTPLLAGRSADEARRGARPS
jgi:predicted hydrocarbon binding protein